MSDNGPANRPKDANDALKALGPEALDLATAVPYSVPSSVSDSRDNGDPAPPPPRPSLEDSCPTFSDLYGEGDLFADMDRELVSLAVLPSWPGGPTTGHGLGHDLNRVIGGGLCPGYVLAVGAATAGAGKTAFVAQLAEGLALRTAELLRNREPGTLTPVLMLSEMGPRALTWRSLARWTGCDSRIFRAGVRGATQTLGYGWDRVQAAFVAGAEALREGPLAEARSYLRALRSGATGAELVGEAAARAAEWSKRLEREHDRAVLPVLVLDPVQRWQDSGNEVEALNHLVEALGAVAEREGLAVVMTSDTNKSAATGYDQDKADSDRGRAMFRGSYKLQHLADATLFLERDDSTEGQTCLKAMVSKNRWGSSIPNPVAMCSYKWAVGTGRFEPLERPPAGAAVPVSGHSTAKPASDRSRGKRGGRK